MYIFIIRDPDSIVTVLKKYYLYIFFSILFSSYFSLYSPFLSLIFSIYLFHFLSSLLFSPQYTPKWMYNIMTLTINIFSPILSQEKEKRKNRYTIHGMLTRVRTQPFLCTTTEITLMHM